MLSISNILGYGLILSVGMSVLILGSFWVNPRLWLQDYPAEVRAKVPPLTRSEKRQQIIIGVLFLVVTFGTLFFSARQFRIEQGGGLAFVTAFAHVYLVFTVFNLFDLLVLDGFVLGVLKPKFLLLPGAEEMAGQYQDFGFHLRAFWKGLAVGVVVSAPIALAAVV